MDEAAKTRIRRLAILLGTATFFLIMLIAFHEVLVPFIVAVVLAYVLHPAVEWFHRRKIAGRNLPRWSAVLLIYLVLIGIIVLFATTMLPRLGAETTALVRAVPGYIAHVRDEVIPSIENWASERAGLLFRPPLRRDRDSRDAGAQGQADGAPDAAASGPEERPPTPAPVPAPPRLGPQLVADGAPSDAAPEAGPVAADAAPEAGTDAGATPEATPDAEAPAARGDVPDAAPDPPEVARPSMWQRIWTAPDGGPQTSSTPDAGVTVGAEMTSHELEIRAPPDAGPPDAAVAQAPEPEGEPARLLVHRERGVVGIGGRGRRPPRREEPERTESTILIRPVTGGGYAVDLPDEGLMIEQIDDGRYRVGPRRRVIDESPLNLRRQLDDVFARILEQGEHHAISALRFTQRAVFITVEFVFSAILSLMLAAFILATTPTIMGFFRSLFPPRLRGDFDQVVTRVDKGLGGVIRGQLMICLINGILSGIGFAIAGLRYWPVWTLLATVASLVPIFGTIVSSVPAIAVGLSQGWGTGLFVFIWIVGIHELEANIFNPKIMGDAARMHPVIVVFALLAGAHAGGVLGALLGVPVASIIQSLFKFLRARAYGEEESESMLPPPPKPEPARAPPEPVDVPPEPVDEPPEPVDEPPEPGERG